MLTANEPAALAALAVWFVHPREFSKAQIKSMTEALNAALPLIEDAGEPLADPPPMAVLGIPRIEQTRPAGGEHKMLSDQIAGLADVVTRSEGRTADRVADLARLIGDLAQIKAPTFELPSVDLGRTEPTEADLWQAALGMAADQRDRKQFPGVFVLRQALWFLSRLQDGPDGAREYLLDNDDEEQPEPAVVNLRPHVYAGVQRRPGAPGGETDPCHVKGCGLPPESDWHKVPGTAPHPIGWLGDTGN